MKPQITAPPSTALRAAWRALRPALLIVGLFSVIVNLLALTPTLYMMQVYDRAVASGHVGTLALLSLIALASLAMMALFDWLRARILVRAGRAFDAMLAPAVAARLVTKTQAVAADRGAGLRRLDTVRQVIASPLATVYFDLPLMPLYVAASFLLHWSIGVLGLASAALLLVIAILGQRSSHAPRTHSLAQAEAAQVALGHLAAHADDLRAGGIAPGLLERYLDRRAAGRDSEARAAFLAGGYSGATRFLRMTIQSGALGLGGLLAIDGFISGGAVIASSLLLGRVLAPIDQIVGGWQALGNARDSHAYLKQLLADAPIQTGTTMPEPEGALQAERLTVLAPGSDRIAIANVEFSVNPGEQIGVVGLSGAGKSTLLRAMAGALPAVRGTVRIDGLAFDHWPTHQLNRAIGFLPQNAVLFPGTVKDNIARFEAESSERTAEKIDADVVAAAMRTGAHDMIVRLPDGYDTMIGTGEPGLSAGQIQRVALARAMYRGPRILILDEPTANLDSEACYRLIRLLSSLRGERVTVLLGSHSGEVLASLDKLLVLKAGAMTSFAPPPNGRLQVRNADASKVT
ncbi:type I secretion system permease/ATPase [Stakelama pacifica]|uniref:ATP-binding cassette subfamily C protein/ATP-binding cassette subfamily C exporter for protease/lipase n=1 Tax=Stakelama pacifica TaxID=517720 RepID=A0A4R6FKV2_9SPHN|nr:ATP-binding cassette domain-containing protein [Stakelama pacifica]TDN81214.1 ATP-binding cassette subfamily C protein/ATP-binding cassette subfamily C exporter for protease/lipase [Stakelama pacifica]